MRIGIDLGGTKISGVVLAPDGTVLTARRVATPRGDYQASLTAIAELVTALERDVGSARPLAVGIGTPGSLIPGTERLRNANSVWLNGQPLQRDLEALIGRPIRMANDADCLAMSEARDGAGQGRRMVFAAILGTGVGGGLVFDGQLWGGRNRLGGEWGHTQQPWLTPADGERRACWCGQIDCVETWLSGPGLARTHAEHHGADLTAEAVACSGTETLERYCSLLARGLAGVINLLDPDVIVLGGGVSQIDLIYARVPELWQRWTFADSVATELRPAHHGDDSGVRGAAWL